MFLQKNPHRRRRLHHPHRHHQVLRTLQQSRRTNHQAAQRTLQPAQRTLQPAQRTLRPAQRTPQPAQPNILLRAKKNPVISTRLTEVSNSTPIISTRRPRPRPRPRPSRSRRGTSISSSSNSNLNRTITERRRLHRGTIIIITAPLPCPDLQKGLLRVSNSNNSTTTINRHVGETVQLALVIFRTFLLMCHAWFLKIFGTSTICTLRFGLAPNTLILNVITQNGVDVSKQNKKKRNVGTISMTLECPTCNFKVRSNTQLEEHIRTHTGERPFKCGWCDYAAAQKSTLTTHVDYVHKQKKPFPCSVCEYKAARRPELKKHMRKHTGEKPFQCDKCEFASAERSNLRVHLKKHTGEKPFVCDVCGFRASRKSHLLQHKQTHTGEKQFACSSCDFRTGYLCNLKRHQDKHKVVPKKYFCDLCSFASAHSFNYKAHLRVHTEELPYKCSMCDYKCAQAGSLTRHVKLHAFQAALALLSLSN
jgi:hypothetical protein